MLEYVGNTFLSILSREAYEFISTSLLEIGEDDIDEIQPASIVAYMEQNQIYACMFFCQYCNKVSFFKGNTPIYERIWSCPHCHESEMTYKGLNNTFFSFFYQDIKNILEENRDYLIERHRPLVIESGRYVQLLYFPLIVNMATELEIFFRNIYAGWMNQRYVKDEQNLYSKFFKETKNIFTNIDKINDVFKKELNIDIRNLLREGIVNDIKSIFAKRHVIVHNSGIVDKQYKSSIKDDYNIGDMLEISNDEIERYKQSTNHIKSVVGMPYLSEVKRSFIDKINGYFVNDYANPIVGTERIPAQGDTIYLLNITQG